jgi:hypothetical protein
VWSIAKVNAAASRACKNMTANQLGSVIMDNGFGALTEFCSRRAWSEPMRKHNHETYDYHLSSVWMLANTLRAIVAEWNFQLCGVMSLEIFTAGE